MGHGYQVADGRAGSKGGCRKDGWLPALSAAFRKQLFNYFLLLRSALHQSPPVKLWALIRHIGRLLPDRPLWEFKLQDLLQPEPLMLHNRILTWAIMMIRIKGFKEVMDKTLTGWLSEFLRHLFGFFLRISSSLKCFPFFSRIQRTIHLSHLVNTHLLGVYQSQALCLFSS